MNTAMRTSNLINSMLFIPCIFLYSLQPSTKDHKIQIVKYNSWWISFYDDTGGDQDLNWRVGLVFLCCSKLSKDGTPVPKHVGVDTRHKFWVHLLVNLLNSLILFYVIWQSLVKGINLALIRKINSSTLTWI